MKTTKFYKLIIAVLVVINLTTLSFLFLGKKGRRPHGNLGEIIGLSGESLDRVAKLEKEHHKEKKALMQQTRSLYKSLYENITNEEKAKSILDSINLKNEEIDSMTYYFFHTISDECNDEQLKELNQAIEKGIGRLWRGKRR